MGRPHCIQLCTQTHHITRALRPSASSEGQSFSSMNGCDSSTSAISRTGPCRPELKANRLLRLYPEELEEGASEEDVSSLSVPLKSRLSCVPHSMPLARRGRRGSTPTSATTACRLLTHGLSCIRTVESPLQSMHGPDRKKVRERFGMKRDSDRGK